MSNGSSGDVSSFGLGESPRASGAAGRITVVPPPLRQGLRRLAALLPDGWGGRASGYAAGGASPDPERPAYVPASVGDDLRGAGTGGPADDRTRLLGGAQLSDGGWASSAGGEASGAGGEPETPGRRVARHARAARDLLVKHWYRLVLLVVLATLIVLTAVFGVSVFGDVLHWFQSRNNWAGWGMFLGLYTAVVALFLPGVVFIMGGGLVFGFWRALLAVWIGGAVGQALAFLLARYLLRDWVEDFVRGKWKKWEHIDRAIELEGWKLVLIMRLSPVIPYNLLNIAMATTSMPFWQFTAVSAVGIVFESAVLCYVGSMATSITGAISGESAEQGKLSWILLGISIVMCAVGAVFASYTIRNAIARAEDLSGEGAGVGASVGAAGGPAPPFTAAAPPGSTHPGPLGRLTGSLVHPPADYSHPSEYAVSHHIRLPGRLGLDGYRRGAGAGATGHRTAPPMPAFELKAVSAPRGDGTRLSSSLDDDGVRSGPPVSISARLGGHEQGGSGSAPAGGDEPTPSRGGPDRPTFDGPVRLDAPGSAFLDGPTAPYFTRGAPSRGGSSSSGDLGAGPARAARGGTP